MLSRFIESLENEFLFSPDKSTLPSFFIPHLSTTDKYFSKRIQINNPIGRHSGCFCHLIMNKFRLCDENDVSFSSHESLKSKYKTKLIFSVMNEEKEVDRYITDFISNSEKSIYSIKRKIEEFLKSHFIDGLSIGKIIEIDKKTIYI